tara:strand:+ start:746 stop:1009 length:264 start_codon:yes stop_codon:yes gene_type:complete
MTENELLDLGFTKEASSDTVDGVAEFYYYVKDITNGLSFISGCSDEIDAKGWYIEFFETEIPVRYYDLSTVKELFILIEKGIKPKQR